MKITFLDGPMGTQLIDRGHRMPTPAWSAAALSSAPEAVYEVHRDYVHAGATVHTTNTFRTRHDSAGSAWAQLARKAVRLTRRAVPDGHRVAGSIAPLADCYRPDLSPPDPGPQHAELANILHDEGCDLLLCETFPHIPEAMAAVAACVATGCETWVSFTAGPRGDLLEPEEVHRGAHAAVDLGARGVLVNCIPARITDRYIEAILDCGVPFGAYANAGHPDEGLGWCSPEITDGPQRYAEFAAIWVEQGATLIGSCCGTGPEHIKELVRRFS